MRSLNDTVARLTRMKRSGGAVGAAVSHRLSRLAKFGSNPGELGAWTYVPATLKSGAPLVVVLHGCTQTAGGYDESAGWSRLADEYGFALLYPEQKRSNNPNLCFNWFLDEDSGRDRGEALSIKQMVDAAVAAWKLDPSQVFVTGLSAGGAMAAVMLATYPDVFAGGAVIAGLPYGVANSVPEAFDLMRGHGIPGASKLASTARQASGLDGKWPTLSVWHGSSDHTVDPANASALIEQWKGLHGISGPPSSESRVQGFPHRLWRDGRGKALIEEYRVTGMAHGTPLDVGGSSGTEQAAPYMLDMGISSTRLISQFWGIVPKHAEQVDRTHVPAKAHAEDKTEQEHNAWLGNNFVGDTIEQALRSAGLMR
jgi:poly(hydroxyalkanoate) depolymerase family esterase